MGGGLALMHGGAGISVEVEHKDFGTFKHQIPTGPIVLVSSVMPTWAGTRSSPFPLAHDDMNE